MTTDSIIGALGIIGISLLAFSSLNAQDSLITQEPLVSSGSFVDEERIELTDLQLPSLSLSLEAGDVLGVLSLPDQEDQEVEENNSNQENGILEETETEFPEETEVEINEEPIESSDDELEQSERSGLMSFLRNIFSSNDNEQEEEGLDEDSSEEEFEENGESVIITADDTVWDLLKEHGLDSAQTAVIIQNLRAATGAALEEVGIVSQNPDLIYPGDSLLLEMIITLYS